MRPPLVGLIGAMFVCGCAGDAGVQDAGVGSADAKTVVDASGFADAQPAVDAGPMADAGMLPGPVERNRSLVWTQSAIVDVPETVSLAKVMAAASDDDHGGRLFDWMLRRFGTTPYSLRPDQVELANELAMTLGPDPSGWDLSQAPFIVTAVHNRIDLAAEGHCGELRVSFATTHPVIRPFHLIFLFRMSPEPGDIGCRGLAVRFARLTGMDEAAFITAAAALIDQHLTADRFIILESAEFTFSPWEWRQWKRIENTDPQTAADLPFVFENPPMFQTVDIESLNPPGPRRQAFLRWVESNAAAIDRRRVLIPPEYRPRHAVAPAGFTREVLTLTGVDPVILNRYPDLRKKLELVGCPACHTADAEFVQTTEEREFSPFYDKELDARAVALDAWVLGQAPNPPFGPLQSDPALPE